MLEIEVGDKFEISAISEKWGTKEKVRNWSWLILPSLIHASLPSGLFINGKKIIRNTNNGTVGGGGVVVMNVVVVVVVGR